MVQEYYLRLMDWIGGATWDDTRGSIPEALLLILERLQVDPDVWLGAIEGKRLSLKKQETAMVSRAKCGSKALSRSNC